MNKTILDKIKNRTARIGVIGLGYVGLPLAIEFVKAGFPVTGFDIDPEKIKLLKKGKSYIKHIQLSAISSQPSALSFQLSALRSLLHALRSQP